MQIYEKQQKRKRRGYSEHAGFSVAESEKRQVTDLNSLIKDGFCRDTCGKNGSGKRDLPSLKINIEPENGWLEDEFAQFQGLLLLVSGSVLPILP